MWFATATFLSLKYRDDIVLPMKRYEIFTVLSPQLTKEEVELVDKDLESALSAENIKVERKEIKIQQPLAYPIKHQRRGSTLWAEVTTESDSADVATIINKKLFGNEKVLRFLAFTRKAPTPQPGESDTVIGELRRQARARSVEPTHTKEPIAAPAPAASDAPPAEKTKVDVEEIDRKIEELLK